MSKTDNTGKPINGVDWKAPAAKPEVKADAPAIKPSYVAKLLDSLPGLIGGLDFAIMKAAGERVPCVLLIFTPEGAAHVTNMEPKAAMEQVKMFARNLDRIDDAHL
jgi:hypothetical protein